MLIEEIEKVRRELHEMIAKEEDYRKIYLQSIKLDKLIVNYYKKFKKKCLKRIAY
jgi:hypothetical protein